jgi:tRNA pseudouridine55 synthase
MEQGSNSYNFFEGAVLLFNKPLKWTSFDVVNKVRNETRTKKIGHAGTLDPLATGLLILCTGKFTKRIMEFQGQEKEYTGSLILGASTPSFDMETTVDQTYDTAHIEDSMVYETAAKFVGTQLQVAPSHSAKNINGKRAYEIARKGETVDIKPNEVHIEKFEVINISMPKVDFRVVCSKGTYIRSLVNDFGKALNSGAYLSALCRTRIGNFKLQDAWEISDFVMLMKNKWAAEKEK